MNALAAVVRGLRRPAWRQPVWLAWSLGEGVFVSLSCATTAGGYWALSDSRNVAALYAVMVVSSLGMHARLAVGAVHAATIILLSAAGLAVIGAPPRLVGTTLGVGLVGITLIGRYGGRGKILRLGCGLGLLASALMVSGLVAGADVPIAVLGVEAIASGAGGFASVLLMLALDPVLDALFGHATRLTLSEWLSFEHPLLRELSAVAPGTLQHSVNVGVLAAAAATAIRADALLARVGGLYHDVGKSANPEYFIENQDGPNPHDRLDPRESARTVRAHVDDGVARVLAHGMGERIASFVREHHGTGAMRLFCTRAIEQGDARASDDPLFRYPGPRPRSKETGILMLADQVEATARSSPPADLPACQSIVRNTIARVRDEGELDDAGLTSKDYEAIEAALVRTVHAMYHRRLTYPSVRLPWKTRTAARP